MTMNRSFSIPLAAGEVTVSKNNRILGPIQSSLSISGNPKFLGIPAGTAYGIAPPVIILNPPLYFLNSASQFGSLRRHFKTMSYLLSKSTGSGTLCSSKISFSPIMLLR